MMPDGGGDGVGARGVGEESGAGRAEAAAAGERGGHEGADCIRSGRGAPPSAIWGVGPTSVAWVSRCPRFKAAAKTFLRRVLRLYALPLL